VKEVVDSIHLELCSNTYLIRKNYSPLFTAIDKRIHIYERVYRSWFYISYFAWVRGLLYRSELTRSEALFAERIRETSFRVVEKYVNELKELTSDKLEEDSNLSKTVRLLELYYGGNKSMSDYEGRFYVLSSGKRSLFLRQSGEILEIYKPTQEDELIYRVWHKYYTFLYLQKFVENEICNQNYFEISERTRVALDCLEEIQNICRGGFNRIRIKCIYHKRYLEFILNSIEAYLLEKETIRQFGTNSKRSQSHNRFSYDEKFNETVEWMIEQRKIIISP